AEEGGARRRAAGGAVPRIRAEAGGPLLRDGERGHRPQRCRRRPRPRDGQAVPGVLMTRTAGVRSALPVFTNEKAPGEFPGAVSVERRGSAQVRTFDATSEA